MKNHELRRNRERKELRYRILEAAHSLFLRGGETAVTLRRVAEMIEFSATTIYQHFPNKESLLREVCAAEFARFAQSLQRAETLPEPLDRLRKAASLYVDFGLQHPEHYRVLFMRERTGETPDQRTLTNVAADAASTGGAEGAGTEISDVVEPQLYDYLHRAIFKALAAGCFKPEYRDAALLAQTVWSCLHGVVALHMVRAQQPGVPWKPVQNILDFSLEALCNGLTMPSFQTPPTWRR